MKLPLRILGIMAFIALVFGLINLLADGNLTVTEWLYGIGNGLVLIVIVWPEGKP